MSQLYVDQTSATSGSRMAGAPHSPKNLSDGSAVWIESDVASAGSFFVMCKPVGTTTPSNLGTVTSAVNNSVHQVDLCVDSSNNLYFIGNDVATGNSIQITAFKWTGTLGSSYTWTQETTLTSSAITAAAWIGSVGQRGNFRMARSTSS